MRILGELAALTAQIRGKESQAARVDPAQQDDACRGLRVRISRRQAHRDRLDRFHAAGILDPPREQRERLAHGYRPSPNPAKNATSMPSAPPAMKPNDASTGLRAS